MQQKVTNIQIQCVHDTIFALT